ncbi:MAG TPA: hypothetical protein VF345_10910 [Chthoniobacterales bacterium]
MKSSPPLSLYEVLKDVVTPAARTEADKLESRFRVLLDHRYFCNPDALRSRFLAASAEYSANPNDANFALLRQREIESFFFREKRRCQRVAVAAFKHFVATCVDPFFRPLVDRALSLARTQAETIHAEEVARHEKLTGEALTKSSIVDRANRPVREIEQLAATINFEVVSPIQALKALDALFSGKCSVPLTILPATNAGIVHADFEGSLEKWAREDLIKEATRREIRVNNPDVTRADLIAAIQAHENALRAGPLGKPSLALLAGRAVA